MKNTIAGIGLLLILGLAGASVWLDIEVDNMVAPTRLLEGPEGSVYVQAYDKILIVSSEGSIQSSFDIEDDLGIDEPVSDFFVEPDGGLLVGLQYSQTIRIYSPEGEYLGDHPRQPSPMSIEAARDFRFTKDSETGKVFVADTFHHRLQIYDSDGNEINSFTEFSGVPLRYPTGLLFEEGRLYLGDRENERIIVLGPIGEVEREVNLNKLISTGSFEPSVKISSRHEAKKYLDKLKNTERTYPLRVSREGDDIFVLTRARVPRAGQNVYRVLPEAQVEEQVEKNVSSTNDPRAEIAQALERGFGRTRKIHSNEGIDPLDVLARADDVLVADPDLMQVVRYSHYGEALENLGAGALQLHLADMKARKRIFRLSRIGSLLAVGLIFIVLLFSLRKERKTAREKPEEKSPSPTRMALQSFLGPRETLRRKVLLMLIPGLGQVAAGKDFRALLFALPLLALLASRIGSIYALFVDIAALPEEFERGTILFSFFCFGLLTWVAMVVDGIRLDRLSVHKPTPLPADRKLILMCLPFYTVFYGFMAKIIQDVFLVTFLGFNDYISTVMSASFNPGAEIPANLVIYMVMIVGYLLAWGAVVASIMGTTAWMLDAKEGEIAVLAVCGFVFGMILWVVTGGLVAVNFGNIIEGFWVFNAGFGGILTFFIWVVLGPSRVSWFIIPAGISVGWVGEVVGGWLGLTNLPEVISSLVFVAIPSFSIHVAIILIILALPQQKTSEDLLSGGKPFWIKPLVGTAVLVLGLSVFIGVNLKSPVSELYDTTLVGRALVNNPKAREIALKKIEQLDDRRKRGLVPQLIQAIRESSGKSPGSSYNHGKKVSRILARVGPVVIPQIMEALDDPDASIRYSMAEALGMMGAEAVPAVPALSRILGDPEDFVRRGTAAFIGMIGPEAKEAIPALVEVLQKDTDLPARGYAAISLGKIGNQSPEVIPALISVFQDYEVGSEAAKALGEIGSDAVPALVNVLREGDAGKKIMAVKALGIIGPDAGESVPLLLALMRGKEGGLKRETSEALSKIGPSALVDTSVLIRDLSSEDDRVRFSAILGLKLKGPEAVPGLARELRNGNDEVRFWVSTALGMIGPEARSAVRELQKLRRDKNDWLRGNVVWALGEIDPGQVPGEKGIPDQLAALEKLLEGPKPRALKENSFPQDVSLILHVVKRLEKMEEKFAGSPKMDQIIFTSGSARVLLGNAYRSGCSFNKITIGACSEVNTDDYEFFLGSMYKGGDFQRLIAQFPDSSLADDAAFAIADEKTRVGECEGDMDCYVGKSINTFMPFLKEYPDSPLVPKAIDYINSYGLGFGLSHVYDSYKPEDTGALLDEYVLVLWKLKDPSVRFNALLQVPPAYSWLKQPQKADSLYKELIANYPDSKSREQLEASKKELKEIETRFKRGQTK